MKLVLVIPDDLAEQYEGYAIASHKALEQVLVERLKETRAQDPKGRHLVVTGLPLTAIEDQFGCFFQHGEELALKVRRLASLRIGEHHIEFTPGQWEELQHRAKKRGLTVADEIRQIWRKLQSDFFTYV